MFNGSPLDKRELWYSNAESQKRPLVDEWGNETGETVKTWSDPAKLVLNVGPPVGQTEANPFGGFTDYSLVVSSSSRKRNCPLVEGSRVWFGISTGSQWNYTVVKVAEHITDTLYALREVIPGAN